MGHMRKLFPEDNQRGREAVGPLFLLLLLSLPVPDWVNRSMPRSVRLGASTEPVRICLSNLEVG